MRKKMKRVACPACSRAIGLRNNGQIAKHLNKHGFPCRGRLSTLVAKTEIREV